MHIYFSGVGGVGLGPLAEVCLDAGYDVSGSDRSQGPLFEQLKTKGAQLHVGQDTAEIAQIQTNQPVDWLVYTSALPSDHPELIFARQNNIKISKRDELLAHIIHEKQLKLIAIAGTHGKTTTTAMVVWLFKKLGLPVSYSIGAHVSWGPSGVYDPKSQWFVYECDEFDRNFLAFHPAFSLITTLEYDHPDTYETVDSYIDAFKQFATQSNKVYATPEINNQLKVLAEKQGEMEALESSISLLGKHNRQNAELAASVVLDITASPVQDIITHINAFPSTSRRFEKLADNLYSDYAHHPTEIKASLQLARELSDNIVTIYQPHQNLRQHKIKEAYAHCFDEAKKVYWLPTYASREDPSLELLSPRSLATLAKHPNVQLAQCNDELWVNIKTALGEGSVVVILGAGDVDEWVRDKLRSHPPEKS